MRNRRSTGFSIAITLMVTAIITILAGGVVFAILNNLKGSVITQHQSQLYNEAELGLRMAESEIYRDIDQMIFSVWTAVATDALLGSSTATESNTDLNPDDDKKLPLRQLQLLGNARNWPAFANWDLMRGGAFDPASPSTRGWWYVPRDNDVDNCYYVDCSFPIVILNPNMSPDVTPPAMLYPGTTDTVQPVSHNFWYKNVLPIRATMEATHQIPANTVWNNEDDEYGNGNNALADPRMVFDTPFYKKIYKLQNKRKVAVYCRLDLRDYFPPITVT
ncbi:MAG: hypothetical protein HY692_02480, partial [Cyanobacteria bacterium NC_groundwater_1444_Ag_S-0.65um_54_12]|nr:hypothetical protein [Cyanobacteria bacterium NC_groundwater_1444_Ag_S-0.65um_54_12]